MSVRLTVSGSMMSDPEEVNITMNFTGGYPKFVSQGFNEDWFPLWLQDAGYNTYYVGKLFNSHSVTTYNDPFVKGFNGSDFLLDPFTYSYWNSSYQLPLVANETTRWYPYPRVY